MGNYHFVPDLEKAKETEKEIAEKLQNKYGAVILEFGKTNEYDLLLEMKGMELSFEIKEDFYCEKSGNVAVEFECRGKPSGISVSKALYYLYKIHTKTGILYAVCKTTTLKKMIDQELYHRVVSGGDSGSNTKNYLFTLETFTQKCKLLPLDN